MSGVRVNGVFKPLRNLRFWIGLWAFAVLVVIVACLIPPPPMPSLPENGDKLEHFAAYFLLASSAVQLFRRGRMLLLVGVALVAMGVCIEFAQGALTGFIDFDLAGRHNPTSQPSASTQLSGGGPRSAGGRASPRCSSAGRPAGTP